MDLHNQWRYSKALNGYLLENLVKSRNAKKRHTTIATVPIFGGRDAEKHFVLNIAKLNFQMDKMFGEWGFIIALELNVKRSIKECLLLFSACSFFLLLHS